MQDSLQNTLQLSDFEEMRTVSIKSLDRMGDDQENKDIVIEALVYLKERMKHWQESQVQSMQTMPESNELPAGQYIDQSIEEDTLPSEEEVLSLIDSNFEQGLLSLKELVKCEQTGQVQLSFEQKERIICRLLQITTNGYRDP